MSWRSRKSNKYNRSEEVEYWLTLIEEQEYSYCPWFDDWDDDFTWEHAWWHYSGGGYVHNMDELHKMKLLTLLRSLNIKSTIPVLKEAGW